MSNANDGNVKPMSYQDLRRMVECAASYRGKPKKDGDKDVPTMYDIVIHNGQWHVEEHNPARTGGDAVIPFELPVAERPQVNCAEIGTKGGKVNLLDVKKKGDEKQDDEKKGESLGPADAVFWSAAAVEKFLVPYYASVYGDEAPKMIEKLINVLGTSRSEAADSAPFAVAHMPKSEYVPVDGSLVVLLPGGSNGSDLPYAMPLSQYLP